MSCVWFLGGKNAGIEHIAVTVLGMHNVGTEITSDITGIQSVDQVTLFCTQVIGQLLGVSRDHEKSCLLLRDRVDHGFGIIELKGVLKYYKHGHYEKVRTPIMPAEVGPTGMLVPSPWGK